MENESELFDSITAKVKELTRKAYLESLQKGISVMVVEGNNIVLKHPDGRTEFVKEIPEDFTLEKRTYYLKS
jgi:hypothetical protein